MQILEIPETTTELRDLKVFINAVQEFNKFQKNIQSYCAKIIRDEFLKEHDGWEKTLSPEHWAIVKEMDYGDIFYCHKTNKFIKFYKGKSSGWSMGQTTGATITYSMSDDGIQIFVKASWKYQEARFGHIPWHSASSTYVVDLIEKSVKEKH